MKLQGTLLLLTMMLCPQIARADVITLSDANSTFAVDAHSQAGAFSWQVDGTEHLMKEWFWYRVGATGRERSIDTLTFLSHTASDTDFDSGLDTLLLRYRHTSFTLDVEYQLTGGAAGAGTSSLTETVTITSTRTFGNIAVHLFEYSDFNLQGTASDDTGTVVDSSTITQTDPTAAASTVTVVNPPPSHYEIAPVPAILNSLNDGSPTTLADSPAVGGSTGPGDVAFAFEWEEILLPGETFVIAKQKTISGSATAIPEPGTLVLLGSGLTGLQCWRRRRARRA